MFVFKQNIVAEQQHKVFCCYLIHPYDSRLVHRIAILESWCFSSCGGASDENTWLQPQKKLL